MILTTTTETVPFVAPWRETDATAPKFLLRAASVIERGQLEAELAGVYRAGQVYSWAFKAAIRDGINELLADDPGRDDLLALLDVEDEDTLTKQEVRLLEEVRKILAEHWSPYKDLIEQMERRRAIAPIVALRRFCVGIEGIGIDNLPIPFAVGRDGTVGEATLKAIEPLELTVAGNRAYALAYGAGVDAEKNSEPDITSGSTPQSSKPRVASKAGGRSRAKPGTKTHGSRSRRGSGK